MQNLRECGKEKWVGGLRLKDPNRPGRGRKRKTPLSGLSGVCGEFFQIRCGSQAR